MAIEIIGRKPSHEKHYRIDCNNHKCDAVLKFTRPDLEFLPSNGGYPDVAYKGIRCPKCIELTGIAEVSALEIVLAKLEYEEPSQR